MAADNMAGGHIMVQAMVTIADEITCIQDLQLALLVKDTSDDVMVVIKSSGSVNDIGSKFNFSANFGIGTYYNGTIPIVYTYE